MSRQGQGQGTRKKKPEKEWNVWKRRVVEELETMVKATTGSSASKEKHGEVFTPLSFIEEMCDAFPSEIWKRPDATWLDPACGMGHFLLVVFFRYMDGLEKVIPSVEKRARHIVEKMLFMTEINPVNARKCRALFRLVSVATPSVRVLDFLEDALPASWPSSYDCVVGNPPYNLGGTKRTGTKRTHLPFTRIGLSLLKPRGYLGFICPPSYRETGTPMNLMFQEAEGHFVFLRILGANPTHRAFRIQGRVDVWLYQKGVRGTTRMVDEYDVVLPKVTLRLDRHIPNFAYPLFHALYDAVEKWGKVEAFRTTEKTTVHSEAFGCRGTHRLLHLIVEEGRRVYRSREAHSLESVPKVLVNGLGLPYVFYDKKGAYGPTQTPVVVLRPTPAVVHLLRSPLFVCIAWGLRLTGNNNLPYLFDAVPALPSGTSEKEMARVLGLSASQMEWVAEHFSSYSFEDTDVLEPC